MVIAPVLIYEGGASMRTAVLSATMMLLVTTAFAQSLNEQPAIAHAYYGRDGFWHCDPGYVAGESGQCEQILDARRLSASGRLREFELAGRTSAGSDTQEHRGESVR